MSDLKLYKGINYIDDDLIEDADCKQKPVIHKYYAFAASAAAILLAVGTSGSALFRSAGYVKDPLLSDSNTITVTTTAGTTPAATTQCTVTSAQSAASDPAITIHTTAHTVTAATSVSGTVLTGAASQTAAHAASGTTAVTGASGTDKAPEQENDFEYEGSLIMKKYAALFASLLTISNVTAANAQAQTFEPINENLSEAMDAKAFIEEYDVDIDFNCDGKFDIFDVYAYYRADMRAADEKYGAVPRSTVPDYIWEKYKAVPNGVLGDRIYINKETGEKEVHKEKLSLYTDSLMDYYFEYVAPPQLELMDTNFYIDNCPDIYGDPISYDVIRHDGDILSMWDFQRTKLCITDDGETYRLIDKADAEKTDPDSHYSTEASLGHMYGVRKSPMHEFIEDLRRHSHYTGRDRAFVKQLIEGGYVDPDINSDGIFDMEDIALTAVFADNHSNCERGSFFDSLYYPTGVDYYRINLADSYDSFKSEEEWGKAFTLCDTLSNYCDKYSDDIVQYLAEYYLTYNEVDQKYFDPFYYVENGYTYYRQMNGFSGKFFNVLGYYENFSIKYGPSSANNSIEPPEGFWFTKDEIDAAFPEYYKNVKSGVLPEPDIDLSGSIDVADYNLLFNLGYEYFTPYDTSYIGSMVRRYPQLDIVLDVPQEVRDNFNNNFDFNHNGISCDTMESDCMMMYILSELEKQYDNEDDMDRAMDDYYMAHRGAQYFEVFDNNMEKFFKERCLVYTGYIGRDDLGSVTSSVENIRSYKNYPLNTESTEADEFVSGDANCNGRTELSDVLLIMQSLANPSRYGVDGTDANHITSEGRLRADVDGNGLTNMDALIIKNRLLQS
ncbi:hypothetical protein [uncultured Ruminococcus sp.]|uniref:hypothetical protein n=1 Tax=uncultured Ruminococcus sp. TaxID=165186 RepID=UPI002630B824|nr:hypothetical protein [uncultured Ruminococcus sp.]